MPGRVEGWRPLALAALLLLALGGLVIGGAARWLAVPALTLLVLETIDLRRRLRTTRTDLKDRRQDIDDLIALPMQVPFLCDPQGRMIEIGKRWEDWTGQPLSEAFAGRWIDRLHGDDRESTTLAWTSALAAGTTFDHSYRVQFADGSFRWVRSRAHPHRDDAGAIRSWTGISEDDHERILATERMRQTAGLLEMIGSSTDSIIWAKDRDGRMLYINHALERLAGTTLADVLGKLTPNGIRTLRMHAPSARPTEGSWKAASPTMLRKPLPGPTGLPGSIARSAAHFATVRARLSDRSGSPPTSPSVRKPRSVSAYSHASSTIVRRTCWRWCSR